MINLFQKNIGKKMKKKNNMKLINISDLIKYLFIIFICLNINNHALANPKKIVKNVICKEKNIFKDFLENNQKEKLTWFGLSEDGSSITELYVSPSTNNWTILETDTNGISCATVGGKDSQKLMNN